MRTVGLVPVIVDDALDIWLAKEIHFVDCAGFDSMRTE